MKSKRFLAMLVALCLVIGAFAPSAAAAHKHGIVPGTSSGANRDNDRLVSNADKTGINSLRGKDGLLSKNADGKWVINASKLNLWETIRKAALPECIEELRKAAKTYEATDIVSAFVVLEKAPLIETYGTMAKVPAAAQKKLQTQQSSIINKIEKNVLEGKKLDVTDQFTFLTNSVIISTEFGNLEAIAKLPGVKSVFLAPVYEACEPEDVALPNTVSSGNMSNVSDVWTDPALGYTGTGMTIAILDTGLDMDHPSFAADPQLNEYSWDVSYVASMLDQLNAAKINGSVTAEDLYHSAKVPFTFDYAAGIVNVNHDAVSGDHGSHVAGIAAANRVEGTNVVGMAPDAQIIVMKVFGENGGAAMEDILAALEDAMTLGCDVANLSLGSPAGFSSLDPEIDAIYARIAESDIIVDIAAGNEGTSSFNNMWGTDLNPTFHIDNATISSPATFQNAMAVGSVDNKVVPAAYFSLADGTQIFYMDSVEYLYGETSIDLTDLAKEELEYVIVPGLGTEEDFTQVDVEGKVAVVKRGEISFSEKCLNAQAFGAVACLIWDNVTENIFAFGMTTASEEGLIPGIPVGLISLEDGAKMADAAAKTLCVSAEAGSRIDASGGQMSSFSSWGVSPDLRLVPDISGVGGNVYSCYDNGQYGMMSGTSMASPQVAGVTALVLQYLREQFPNASEAEIRVLADSLLMSTAVPVVSEISGVEASPRQQGSGLVNALYAVTSGAYLTVHGSERPKAELFDNEDGVYTFSFDVVNYSNEAKTYNLSYSLLAEDFVNINGVDFMAGYDRALSGSVTFDVGSTVAVAAGKTVTVQATIQLSEEDKAWMAEHFANGNYVEGFVYLNTEEGVDMSLPFLGFYGDWTDAPLFDSAYWYDNSMWGDTTTVDGSESWHILWTDLGGTDWVLGFNPYMGAMEDAEGNIYYDPANNTISSNGDGLADNLQEIYLSLMRNARTLTFTYTDETGKTVYSQIVDYANKTMYRTSYGQIVPYIHSWYIESYDFTDQAGKPLADGTKLTLSISGTLDYEGSPEFFLEEIPITVDTSAPTLVGEPVESTVDGRNYVTVTVSENALAYVAVLNSTGTRYLAEYGDMDFVKNNDGTYSVTLDVTGFGSDMMLLLADYGCNESLFELTYSEENLPEIDASALYAYRVHDALIEEYLGYDYQFGWVTIGKNDAAIEELTLDAFEYYALTAAEYAGGYIFAVDAGGNFLVMQPGLWNRQIICNLGIKVTDMTFDASTQTMYLAAKAESLWGDEMGCLYTIDLLTGELELLQVYDSTYDMPYAMAAVDGEIYAIKNGTSGWFKTSAAEEYYLVPVTDAEGNEIIPMTSTGDNVIPYYSQSMTYSQADGKIYWAYYSYAGMPELFAIDPTDSSYTSVPFATDSEYVGLLTLEEDGFTLPEAEGVEGLLLSSENVLLLEGETAQVTANPIPWNAELGQITWISSDESVATVDENGIITAVAEGSATITAICGEVEAYCEVTVVSIQGSVYAYNYYNGTDVYGDWISVDLAGMTMESLYDSPVDFVAADYNGHTGKIYGYDMNGQAYCFDPATGECAAIGAPVSSIPMDMAYDYSTGFMYAITIDQMAWTTTLHYVNMNTGALIEVATAYDVYLTLACDLYGTLFAASAEGTLYMLSLYEDDWGGGGIWSFAEVLSETNMAVDAVPVMEGFGSLQYQQSMCYDHNTDKLVWANPEMSTIYWIDPYAWEPYAVSLGEPTGSGLIEFTGLYSIPAEIPELEYMPVESVEAKDMLVLVGGMKMPDVTVSPLNATNQVIEWTSADESIAYVTETGAIMGVKLGSTTISGKLVDGETTYDISFSVTVKESAGSVYGYVLTDMATYGGLVWASISDADPTMPEYLAGSIYTIYAQEYVDGFVYAYGFNGDDWESNWQFMTIDPETFDIVDMKDLGEGFPFVYDITYDYTTGTMYALAGPDDSSTDLYMVNMNTGALIPVMQTEPFFMSIAATADGTLYAMAASEEDFDPETGMSTYGNAVLYTIDVASGTYEVAFDTGIQSNMLSSMTYDYTTGNLYWSALFNSGAYVGGLHLIDLESQSAYNLGAIGMAGSQVSGLYTISDPEFYPAGPDSLQNVSIMSTMETLSVGETVALETFIQPADMKPEMTWTSMDPSVATVDENGVVTAVASGVTTVTVTATLDGKSFTATCVIVVFDAQDYFLSYNTTGHGWAQISRGDTTLVTEANADAEDLPAVRSAALVNGVIYGYDVNNGFFTTTEESGFVRNYLGEAEYATTEDTETEDYFFEIRDMAWDGERMLAILCESVTIQETDWWGDTYTTTYELSGGTGIYEVDLETGSLTLLCTPMAEDGNEVSNVYSIAADANGVVYIYSTYDDYICSIDLETGMTTKLNSLSRLSIYGGSDGEPMAMVYDPITLDLYLLMTQNGNYYRMFSFDTNTYALTEVGNVGETAYDPDLWATFGDSFAGLVLDAVHTHAWSEWTVTVEATCANAGEKVHSCYCGEVETAEIPAEDHVFGDWVVTTEPTCTEPGVETRSCACGETEERAVEATGHHYESVVTDPTCTEKGFTTHTCACGDSYTDSEVEATGHDYESVVTDPTTDAEGFTTHTCKNCGDTYVDSYTDKLPPKDPDNSETGDSFGLSQWAVVLVSSVIMLAVLVIGRKHNRKA